MKTKKVSKKGVSYSGVLFLIFLVLKLTKVITWSWWWITAPLWGGIAILIAFIVLFILIKVLIS